MLRSFVSPAFTGLVCLLLASRLSFADFLFVASFVTLVYSRLRSFFTPVSPLFSITECRWTLIPHAPQCNAYAERFIRSARVTLDQFILLGECHLWNVLKAIERHHNYHRPHQGIDNRIPLDYPYPDLPAHPPDVACESALGGLLNHYFVKERAA